MTKGKTLELTGQVFGRLTIVSRADTVHGHIRWDCICDCGKKKIVRGASLTSGDTISCGCFAKERALEASVKYYLDAANNPDFIYPATTHGMSSDPTYHIYRGMLTRCNTPTSPGYAHYGALGVKVCSRWQESFKDFLSDVGLRPSVEFSLERLDGLKGYEPGNVVWATDTQQARNKRMYKSNVSGKTGVRFVKRSDSWLATSTNPRTNVSIVRTFSARKYGYDEAYLRACRARDEMIADANAAGAGYSESHGKATGVVSERIAP
jgi:hypothetical protein